MRGFDSHRTEFWKNFFHFFFFLVLNFVQIAFTMYVLLICVTYLTKFNRYFGLKFEGSSMAERQRFGCLDTWPCIFIQITSLRFPIAICIIQKKWENEMDSFLSKWETIKKPNAILLLSSGSMIVFPMGILCNQLIIIVCRCVMKASLCSFYVKTKCSSLSPLILDYFLLSLCTFVAKLFI